MGLLPSAKGPLFIGLNVLRLLSVVALLLVFAANVVTIVQDIKAVKADKVSADAPAPAFSASAAATPDKRSHVDVRRVLYEPWPTTTDSATTTADAKLFMPAGGPDFSDLSESITFPDVFIGLEPVSTIVPDGIASAKVNLAAPINVGGNFAVAEPSLSVTGVASASSLAPSASSSPTSTSTPPATVTLSPVYTCDYYKGATVPSQAGGTFWSVLNRVFILAECILLILSEIGFPKVVFVNYIPMLGPEYGLGFLGVLQTLIASGVLSHACGLFAQVSAWLLFMVAMGNILVGIFLRDKAKVRRNVFKWENYEDLTPQTRLAGAAFHAGSNVFHTVSEWKEKTSASSAPSFYSQNTPAPTRGAPTVVASVAPPRSVRSPSPSVTPYPHSDYHRSDFDHDGDERINYKAGKEERLNSFHSVPISPGRFGGFPWGRQRKLDPVTISRPLETLAHGARRLV